MAGESLVFSREITQLSFFFSDFQNSDEAVKYLIQNDKGPGTFLLRPSTRSPGTLTLTISIGNNHARHVNVQQKRDDNSKTGVVFFIIPERSFSSFHELYGYYTANAIHNLEQVTNVKLLHPLNKAQQTIPIPASPEHHTPPSTTVLDVAPNEIPPLPQKPVHYSSSQTGFLEVSSVIVKQRQGRSSLDSQGNENLHTSSGSSGSGTVTERGSNIGMGAVGGFALGSTGFSKISDGAARPFSDTYLSDVGKEQEASQQSFSMVSYVPMPLSKKEQKKLQKQEQKEQKQRKKEERKMKKKKAQMDDLMQLGWCRPPIPTPKTKSQSDEDHPYYSSPRPYKNHLEELKKMLRESEICDCGLRMLDAELVDGWTVHRSRENATYKRVFYQHEDGNTTWLFPTSITDLLSVQQVEFIVRLCKEANQDVPAQVIHRYQLIMQSATGVRQVLSASSRPGSDANISNPSGSNETFNRRSTSLDQRPPVSGPG